MDIKSTTLGSDGHIGVTVFDSDSPGPNVGGHDPDLLVNLGNILVLQNDDTPGTAVDPNNGLYYTGPNDERNNNDRGSIEFTFLAGGVAPLSIDLIDMNGGSFVEVTLTDTAGDQRIYSVPAKWTTDPTQDPNGRQALDLTTLVPQPSETLAVGGDATAVEIGAFDPLSVVKLDVAFIGSSTSGGMDNLRFDTNPTTTIPAPAAVVAIPLLTVTLIRRRAR